MVGWVGLGWAGCKKMDPRPTLVRVRRRPYILKMLQLLAVVKYMLITLIYASEKIVHDDDQWKARVHIPLSVQ